MKENQTYESDDLNPEYLFNLVHTKLLLDIATGELNAQELARKNIDSRDIPMKF